MSDELVRCDSCGSMVSEEPHGMSLRPHRCTERQRERLEAWEMTADALGIDPVTADALSPDAPDDDHYRPYVPEESE